MLTRISTVLHRKLFIDIARRFYSGRDRGSCCLRHRHRRYEGGEEITYIRQGLRRVGRLDRHLLKWVFVLHRFESSIRQMPL
jgi:hypothetical protein